jgi:hypothetical protein
MSVYDSKDTDFVFLYNSGGKSVTLYAGNETAISPKLGEPAIVIRFKTAMDTMILGYISQGACIKIKMTQDSKGFMELISLADFYAAYKQKNPRHIFKQIQPR